MLLINTLTFDIDVKMRSPGANQIRQVRLSEVGRLSKPYTRLTLHVLHRFHQRIYHTSTTRYSGYCNSRVHRETTVSSPHFLLLPGGTVMYCDQLDRMSVSPLVRISKTTCPHHQILCVCVDCCPSSVSL